MGHALEARAEGDLADSVAEILWFRQGRLIEMPPQSKVPLYDIPPASSRTEEVGPGRNSTSVDDAAQNDPASESQRAKAARVARAEVGLLGMPPPAAIASTGRRRGDLLHRGLRWFMRPIARRRKIERPMVEDHNDGDLSSPRRPPRRSGFCNGQRVRCPPRVIC